MPESKSCRTQNAAQAQAEGEGEEEEEAEAPGDCDLVFDSIKHALDFFLDFLCF